MASLDWAIVRTYLHVLAATVWVGGQITLAGLVPALRGLGPDAPRQAARAFNRVAWTAFAVLVLTGIWNVAAVNPGDRSTSYQVVLMIKLLVVAASGVSAAVHAGAKSKAALAIGGALTLLTALVALFLGVW